MLTGFWFVASHFLYRTKSNTELKRKGFFWFYLEGWLLMFLSWVIFDLLVILIRTFSLDAISVIGFLNETVEVLPGLIVVLVLAFFKTLFLAVLVPIYLVYKNPKYIDHFNEIIDLP